MRKYMKTVEDYQRRIDEEAGGKFEALEYNGKMIKPALIRCRTCGHTWSPTPNKIINIGRGCAGVACSGKSAPSKTIEDYQRRIDQERGGIFEALEYSGITTGHATLRCRTCGYTWRTVAGKILHRGTRCQGCFGGATVRTLADYQRRIDTERDGAFEALEYNGYVIIPARIMCRSCGNEWVTSPNSVLNLKSGCPRCNSNGKNAKIIESALVQLVDSNVVRGATGVTREFRHASLANKRQLSIDLHVDGTSFFIESDGEQHYKQVEYFGGEDGFRARLHLDRIKDKWITDNNFFMARIRHRPIYESDGNDGLRRAVRSAVDLYNSGATGVYLIQSV